MPACKGCGDKISAGTAYKQRLWCSDRCRVAYGRRTKTVSRRRVPVAAVGIVAGDIGLVDRVRSLVDGQVDDADDVALAQAALATQLAKTAAEGSVSACRELRLLLLEMRLATDPGYEGEVSQALMLEALLLRLSSVPAVDGIEPPGQPLPPGWRSTELDGEVLPYIGRRWFELRDAQDFAAVSDLVRWVGAHSPEIHALRESGRWSVWPDERDSL
jgi:hypothetical protein